MNSDNSHTRRTIRGANWNLLRVAVNTLLNLGITAVLARLLPPEDFGLLALALVFVGIGDMLSSLGMGSAIIQRKVLTRDHLRVAFTLSLGMGTVLMAIFVGASGPVAGFSSSWRQSTTMQRSIAAASSRALIRVVQAIGSCAPRQASPSCSSRRMNSWKCCMPSSIGLW